jgi:hypothetical protein
MNGNRIRINPFAVVGYWDICAAVSSSKRKAKENALL